MFLHRMEITIQATNLQKDTAIVIRQNELNIYSGILINLKEIKTEMSVYLFAPSPEIFLPSGLQQLSILSLLNTHSHSLTFSECELSISCKPISTGKFLFSMRGVNLDNLDTFDLSDPYFFIYSNENEIYKSEIIMDNLNPTWKEFVIKEQYINNLIKIQVWDKDLTNDDYIGGCEITKAQLMEGTVHIDLHNTKKKGNSKSGELVIIVTPKPDAVTKFYLGNTIGINYLVSCNIDISFTAVVLEYISKSFANCEEEFYGFGSSQESFWKIKQIGGIKSIYNDEKIKNPQLGPCLVAPALINAIRSMDFTKFCVICIFPQRDIVDPKTVSQIISETKTLPIIFRVFISSDTPCPNLDSVQNIQIVKYNSFSFRENIKKNLINITDDIESLEVR